MSLGRLIQPNRRLQRTWSHPSRVPWSVTEPPTQLLSFINVSSIGGVLGVWSDPLSHGHRFVPNDSTSPHGAENLMPSAPALRAWERAARGVLAAPANTSLETGRPLRSKDAARLLAWG